MTKPEEKRTKRETIILCIKAGLVWVSIIIIGAIIVLVPRSMGVSVDEISYQMQNTRLFFALALPSSFMMAKVVMFFYDDNKNIRCLRNPLIPNEIIIDGIIISVIHYCERPEVLMIPEFEIIISDESILFNEEYWGGGGLSFEPLRKKIQWLKEALN